MNRNNSEYFQNHMPENVCFGCGIHNHDGLQIKSYWENEESLCNWFPEKKYFGWSDLLNGGIIATLIDCHCMCTAMAYAYKEEGRSLDSKPIYRYATGTLNIKYLKPTSGLHQLQLKARVLETKGRKTILTCELVSQGVQTVIADVVAIRVYDDSFQEQNNPFK